MTGRTTVSFDRVRGLAHKAFPPGPAGARAAADEHRRLGALHAALAPLAGITCPQPVDLRFGPVPVLTMTFADGTPMVDHLARPGTDGRFVARLAALLVDAAERYAEASGEPIADLHFRNMLLGAGDEVVLLDLGDPPFARPAPDPVVASIGALGGSTLFECCRPAHALRRRASLATARAAAATIEAATRTVTATGATRTTAELRAAVLAVHAGLTTGRGPWRSAWFRSGGAVLDRVYRGVVLP